MKVRAIKKIPKRKRKTPKLMSDRDLSEEIARRVPLPDEDSPGDTAEDEMRETYAGLNFARDPLEEPEDLPLAERHTENGEELEETLSEDAAAKASSRPHPIEDLDKPSSTH